MKYTIRTLREEESGILKDFLYEVIFIPEGEVSPPKSIIEREELQIYIRDFGKFPDDKCLVAELDGRIIGAVWTRIMNDYGHVDEETPSFAISLYPEYRHQGIGTNLMNEMLALLKECGYQKASLSVQKANYAVRMYLSLGFEITDQNQEEYIMLYYLNRGQPEIIPILQNKNNSLDLLLLADEQESMIDRYLERGMMYALSDDGIRAVCVVTEEGDSVLEIKNIAVSPAFQHRGYGRKLIAFLESRYRTDYRILQAGTSAGNVAFYEKCGFQQSGRIRNFFTENYDHPIFENGQQIADMIYLKKILKEG